MRKVITILLATSLALGVFAAPSAQAKKKKKRVATAAYENPAIGSSDVGGGCLGCPSFGTGSNENFVSIEITDSTGLPVPASISWDTDGDGISDTGFEICGKTEEPQPIEAGVTLNVFVWAVPSTVCPAGTATNGTVKATFTR
ncbi:MAG: hypothetical protein ACRDKT_12130 [Actinomycetota bacterium]